MAWLAEHRRCYENLWEIAVLNPKPLLTFLCRELRAIPRHCLSNPSKLLYREQVSAWYLIAAATDLVRTTQWWRSSTLVPPIGANTCTIRLLITGTATSKTPIMTNWVDIAALCCLRAHQSEVCLDVDQERLKVCGRLSWSTEIVRDKSCCWRYKLFWELILLSGEMSCFFGFQLVFVDCGPAMACPRLLAPSHVLPPTCYSAQLLIWYCFRYITPLWYCLACSHVFPRTHSFRAGPTSFLHLLLTS